MTWSNYSAPTTRAVLSSFGDAAIDVCMGKFKALDATRTGLILRILYVYHPPLPALVERKRADRV